MFHNLWKYASALKVFISLSVLNLTLAWGTSMPGHAAPHAAIVQDARTGEILYKKNADKRLHPASLTKMLTLYIVFQEIEQGNLSLDQKITISKNAAKEPPSRLGLKAGQKIRLRYLIRAAAIKSANDAATAIGEAVSGSEKRFAARMTRTAKMLGMKNSTFKNAHGLTRSGHLSTARDMNILGRRLFYDFPEYYNLFSRKTAHAGVRKVKNTNRRFLNDYRGADGIKTGYTSKAGFNLTASAERNGVRIIATVYGGTSTKQRNNKMAGLLDIGFAKAPRHVKEQPLKPLGYIGNAAVIAKSIPLPQARPGSGDKDVSEAELSSIVSSFNESIMEAVAESVPELRTETNKAFLPKRRTSVGTEHSESTQHASDSSGNPSLFVAAHVAGSTSSRSAPIYTRNSGGRNELGMDDDSLLIGEGDYVVVFTDSDDLEEEQLWAVHLGQFGSKTAATKRLVKAQLTEGATLNKGFRHVIPKRSGYNATIGGLTENQAALACRRLSARGEKCFTVKANEP